jgi:hypothetical protein
VASERRPVREGAKGAPSGAERHSGYNLEIGGANDWCSKEGRRDLC